MIPEFDYVALSLLRNSATLAIMQISTCMHVGPARIPSGVRDAWWNILLLT